MELLDGEVPWNGHPIHLQPKVPRKVLVAHLNHVLVLPALDRGGLPLAFSCLLLLRLLLADHLRHLGYLLFLPFLLQVGHGEQVNCRRRRRRRRGWGKSKKRLGP